jgi:hypothetical protein
MRPVADALCVAVLLAPTDDADLERLLLARSARFQAMLSNSRQSIKAGKGLTREAFWKIVERRARKRNSSESAPRRAAPSSC